MRATNRRLSSLNDVDRYRAIVDTKRTICFSHACENRMNETRREKKTRTRSTFAGIVRATESQPRKRASHRKHLYHRTGIYTFTLS
ncbi:hypothetical protein DBV15_06079 [Temnothorax longispinosus]|uniref:Uncharacterized protein n=1 Tax=Temnothorax longispinosus TaxID=300112 RepID=A0A4S2KCW4_9HYME|nr:hypothetical protein DBV15_06079 [Temnothorax longispinosus]